MEERRIGREEGGTLEEGWRRGDAKRRGVAGKEEGREIEGWRKREGRRKRRGEKTENSGQGGGRERREKEKTYLKTSSFKNKRKHGFWGRVKSGEKTNSRISNKFSNLNPTKKKPALKISCHQFCPTPDTKHKKFAT
jgi:hypothetical protein